MIVAHQVTDTGPVAVAERLAIGAAIPMRDIRMTILVAVIDVRRTMVLRIFISASYAIVEALLLDSLILGGRSGPRFIRVIPSLLRRTIRLEGWCGCGRGCG